jgi:hypothetical protein
MFTGALVTADDVVESRVFDGLKEMQDAVNGYLEHVVVDDDAHLYVNEEGLMMNLSVNLSVEWWLNQIHDNVETRIDQPYLRGDIIVFGGIDDDGNEMDVKPEVLDELTKSRPELLRHPDSEEN